MRTRFESFSYNKKNIVSFDFDGVLHLDVVPGTIHPIHQFTKKDWRPNKKMHEVLRNEHLAGNRIIVITARGDFILKSDDIFSLDLNDEYLDAEPILMKFLQKHNLPVERIFFTGGESKVDIINALGVIRHYDDNYDMEYELENTDTEFIWVKDGSIFRRFKNKKKKRLDEFNWF